ncbi:ADP-ribose pyrophosphatase [Halodesulfurarchaeum formicicum]|uniref:ADP-ribose pyrophosphatase n=1 Tax=Halodesulfurarchaeum formicicum TaxID=1873524 RepID=A0A1D8S6Y8_9EURY|nr:NUDIX hydrolase [Halodesulfurarchaeum formicicum]AOW81115.1 ADP-ribose pyrophosphatase [Halodesulfurarchaeum formicicum]APE96457.1 ADP-ribose pyrophosphatase [Halodesulfurarchaeum formicicum]
MDDTGPETDDQAGADSLRWRTESRSTAYTCPGFSIVHEEITLPDGTETDFDYLHDAPSVVILPFTPEGDLVLIEEWRQAVKGLTLGFPAGGVEPGEEPAVAARRELTEETGYVAEALTALDSFEPATGITDAVFHFFVATGCEPTGTQDLDENESIRVTTSTLGALLERVLSGDLRDGRTALGLLRYVAEQEDQVTVAPPTTERV